MMKFRIIAKHDLDYVGKIKYRLMGCVVLVFRHTISITTYFYVMSLDAMYSL